jgi:hypothetical protein
MGRAYARETYPESRRNTTLMYARNFAQGPKFETDINTVAPFQLPWASIDSVDPWDPAVTYSVGDIVSNSGTTWISIQNNNTGNNPPATYLFWSQNEGVPITPRVTGVVVISAVVTLENGDENIHNITVSILVDGIAVSELNLTLISGVTAIPLLAEVTGLPIGTTAIVQIEFVADEADIFNIISGDSTIEVREMQVATG